MEALQTFFKSLMTEERWPWWSAMLVFTVIGQFTAIKLFTRARAYAVTKPWWLQSFWWWGRETLMLHPILAGAALGLVWVDPEGRGWGRIPSQMYFATAGVLSLFLFAVLRGILKRKGIHIELPGTSDRPPADPPVQDP